MKLKSAFFQKLKERHDKIKEQIESLKSMTYCTVTINTVMFKGQLSGHFVISINEDQVIFDNDDNTSFGVFISEITEVKLTDECNYFEVGR
jgi:hypothetical protein